MPRSRPTPRARLRRLAILAAGATLLVWLYPEPPNPTFSPGPDSVLPIYKSAMVDALYTMIAENDLGACRLFTDEAAQQFATHNGAHDCPAAIAKLHTQVRDARRYRHPEIPPHAILDGSTYAQVFTCDLTGGAEYGPRLGNITMRHTPLKTWRITKHEPEDCAGGPR